MGSLVARMITPGLHDDARRSRSITGLLRTRYNAFVDDRPHSSLDAVVECYKRDLDLTLLRENLKRTPTERLMALQELQRFADELRRAGEKAQRRD